MEKAYVSKQPVCVLRAVNRDSKYAPKEGLRYDGLYEITNKTLLDPATAMTRFSMRRVAGQTPIRYQGEEVRPTTQELEERVSMKKDLD
jgi:phenylalanyl-tRNA synthetase beta subunit